MNKFISKNILIIQTFLISYFVFYSVFILKVKSKIKNFPKKEVILSLEDFLFKL